MTKTVDSELLKLVLSKSSTLEEARNFLDSYLLDQPRPVLQQTYSSQPLLNQSALDALDKVVKYTKERKKHQRVEAVKSNSPWTAEDILRLVNCVISLGELDLPRISKVLGRSKDAISSMWTDIRLVTQNVTPRSVQFGRETKIITASLLPEWPKNPLPDFRKRERRRQKEA